MTRIAAVIGAGTIGLSWAALFASKGMAVRVNDPRPAWLRWCETA